MTTLTKNRTDVTIVDIPHERLDEATEVLARAFEDYPVMRYIFVDSRDQYYQRVWDVMRFTAEARLARGNSLKGVEAEGRLVAVACIDHPEEKPWSDSLEQTYGALLQDMGEQAAARLNQFGELVGSHHHDEPHFYLVAIGVHPDVQGQGYGRALLNEVQRMSQAHPTSTGVGLDTETPGNVPLYEHCGYRVTDKANLEEVDVWFMFRSDA